MRVLIAVKKASLRNALETLLQTRPGIEIAGTAADIEELFAQVTSKTPDLLLLDDNFSQKLVEKVIIPLQQFDPCPAVLVLVGRTESRQAYLDVGAKVVIDKGDPPKSLLTAIEGIRMQRNRV